MKISHSSYSVNANNTKLPVFTSRKKEEHKQIIARQTYSAPQKNSTVVNSDAVVRLAAMAAFFAALAGCGDNGGNADDPTDYIVKNSLAGAAGVAGKDISKAGNGSIIYNGSTISNGGTSNTIAPASGGTSSIINTGGMISSGGTVASGGSSFVSTEISNGGTPQTGGTSSVINTGGMISSGGTVGGSSTIATGGIANGGTVASGGSSTVSEGGVSNGGTPQSGGTSSLISIGGVSNGGAVSSGGSYSSAGAPSNGGTSSSSSSSVMPDVPVEEAKTIDFLGTTDNFITVDTNKDNIITPTELTEYQKKVASDPNLNKGISTLIKNENELMFHRNDGITGSINGLSMPDIDIIHQEFGNKNNIEKQANNIINRFSPLTTLQRNTFENTVANNRSVALTRTDWVHTDTELSNKLKDIYAVNHLKANFANIATQAPDAEVAVIKKEDLAKLIDTIKQDPKNEYLTEGLTKIYENHEALPFVNPNADETKGSIMGLTATDLPYAYAAPVSINKTSQEIRDKIAPALGLPNGDAASFKTHITGLRTATPNVSEAYYSCLPHEKAVVSGLSKDFSKYDTNADGYLTTSEMSPFAQSLTSAPQKDAYSRLTSTVMNKFTILKKASVDENDTIGLSPNDLTYIANAQDTQDKTFGNIMSDINARPQ